MVTETNNKEKVDNEIVNVKVNETIDDISSIVFAESDENKKKKIKSV